jgi:hypothetical protein
MSGRPSAKTAQSIIHNSKSKITSFSSNDVNLAESLLLRFNEKYPAEKLDNEVFEKPVLTQQRAPNDQQQVVDRKCNYNEDDNLQP